MNARIVHRVGDVEYGITEAFVFNGYDTGIKLGSDAIRKSAKFIKAVAPNKGSIAKMARDYVMQFPVIASSSIPEEDLFPITKNFEIQYAQFIAMLLQGSAGINVRDIDSTADILKQIHSNDDAPNLLDYALDITGGRGASESVQVGIPRNELEALAFGTDAEFTMENLNSMYQPNQSMLNKYERVTAAMEAKGDKDKPNPAPDPGDKGKDPKPTPYPKAPEGQKEDAEWFDSLGADKDRVKAADEFRLNRKKIKLTGQQYANAEKQGKNLDQQYGINAQQILSNDLKYKKDKLNSVSASDLNKIQNTGEAPTVLTATLYLESQAGIPEPRSLVFGVKTMVRSVPSGVMIPNVTECIASNTWAFKFVKWTKGETKFFRDVLFDITNARKEAINDNDPAGAWFNSVKRRKRNSRWFGSKTNISPVMTLIITDAEAEAIKAQTGIDLMEDKAAAKLMKDMYLLGFAIYHTANGNVDIMLDKYSNGTFYSTTMTGLKAANRGSSNTDLREINKLLQNGGYIR